MNAIVLWLVLTLLFLLMSYLFGARRTRCSAEGEDEQKESQRIPEERISAFEKKLAPVLAVAGHKRRGEVIQFEGTLRSDPDETFTRLRESFASENVTPFLQEGDGEEVRVILVPVGAERPGLEKPKWWLHWLLFALTLATTTWAGALHAGINLLEHPGQFTLGLPYSLALMLILGAHELGHYFTARRHGIVVTPPYFIPVPFSLGTFGAFIKLKSLSPSRRAVFDVAVAGPLAGLVFAIPALLVGLGQSKIIPGNQPAGMLHGGAEVGSSILMAVLAKLSLGASVAEGHRLLLHPLAFAGWLGLMVTALNLLPIGQLDGGHMAHAMFGAKRGHIISVVALVSLFGLALFVWPGLMMWAFIVFFIAGTRDAPPANDITPIVTSRKLLGYFTFLLLLLILVPVPHTLYRAFGIHCPYL